MSGQERKVRNIQTAMAAKANRVAARHGIPVGIARGSNLYVIERVGRLGHERFSFRLALRFTVEPGEKLLTIITLKQANVRPLEIFFDFRGPDNERESLAV